MSFLQVRNLQFSYAQSSQHYRFNLRLDDGAILAVTGRSGSGKSTLLDLIAGFLQPSAGRIVLDEKDIVNLTPAKRQVSILFQKNNLFEHLSVLENVCLALNPNSKPTHEQKQQAIAMLAEVEMVGYDNQIVSQLSGGQMQRVALARELLRDTKLLLLDEPFNGLDETTREIMLPLLKQAVKDKRRSIVLITHDMDSISEITDQAVEVRDGQIFPITTNS